MGCDGEESAVHEQGDPSMKPDANAMKPPKECYEQQAKDDLKDLAS